MRRRLLGAPVLFAAIASIALPSSGSSAATAQQTGAGAPSTSATRLVYDGVAVAGDQQIYSVERSGSGVAQLTFDQAPSSSPLPSPDGRLVLFRRANAFWAMAADGRGQRRLVASDEQPAWAPDSRRIAYLRGGQIREVGVDGKHDRLLARGRTGAIGAPRWSPDGRSLAFWRHDSIVIRTGRRERMLHFRGGAQPLAWSPDGRWIAVDSGRKLLLVDPGGGTRWLVGFGGSAAWSPNGHLLAYVETGDNTELPATLALRVLDVKTGDRRFLTNDVLEADPRWSPKGDEIAFVSRDSLPKVVSLAGLPRPRDLGLPYFWRPYSSGGAGTLSWTRVAAGLRFRPPRPDSLASSDELMTRRPIRELAVDGGRVAFNFCESVGVWTLGESAITWPRREFGPPCSSYLHESVYSLALAGDRAAWGVRTGGNFPLTSLRVTSIASGTGAPVAADTQHGPDGRDRNGDALGSGGLLVFGSRKLCEDVPAPSGRSCAADQQTTRPVLGQTIWRIHDPGQPGSCPAGYARTGTRLLMPGPCEEIATEPGPFVPNDVEAGRIVAVGDNAVAVLDQSGARLIDVQVKALAAQLSGTDLVVLVRGALRAYDTRTGALAAAWPVPDVSSGGVCRSEPCGDPRLRLQDAAHGLAVYVLDGHVHVLRLSDGVDNVLAAGSAARFGTSGLFYAYEGSYPWQGRIRFVPFDQLPLR